MSAAGNHLRVVVTAVNLGWALWTVAAGAYFLLSTRPDTFLCGHSIVGFTLIGCGIASSIGVTFRWRHRGLGRVTALLCALCCALSAIVLQTAHWNRADVNALILLGCVITYVMQWALLLLEPYIDD